MKFATAPKCFVCDKAVYQMEEIKALERVWHKLCFRCGYGAPEDSTGCNKKLELGGGYSERKIGDEPSIPYCNSCYNKHFGPQGTRVLSSGHNRTT